MHPYQFVLLTVWRFGAYLLPGLTLYHLWTILPKTPAIHLAWGVLVALGLVTGLLVGFLHQVITTIKARVPAAIAVLSWALALISFPLWHFFLLSLGRLPLILPVVAAWYIAGYLLFLKK